MLYLLCFNLHFHLFRKDEKMFNSATNGVQFKNYTECIAMCHDPVFLCFVSLLVLLCLSLLGSLCLSSLFQTVLSFLALLSILSLSFLARLLN